MEKAVESREKGLVGVQRLVGGPGRGFGIEILLLLLRMQGAVDSPERVKLSDPFQPRTNEEGNQIGTRLCFGPVPIFIAAYEKIACLYNKQTLEATHKEIATQQTYMLNNKNYSTRQT